MFETLVAKQDPYVPKLDEVKDRVRDEVVKQKARDLSKQKAAELAAKLKSAPDFEKAAKAAGVEAKTTELIARDSPIPDLGVAPAVEDAAFKLPVGAVSDPIATDNGTAVIKVLEKKEVTPAEWTVVEGPLPRGAADRSPQPLLQRLHGEGEAEDEDRRQPRGAAARGS